MIQTETRRSEEIKRETSHEHKPLKCHLLREYRFLYVNHLFIGLLQCVGVVRVVLNQLSQSGKLLSSIEVIELLCSLNANVNNAKSSPTGGGWGGECSTTLTPLLRSGGENARQH